jgi:heme/copper-type cytochrome/quinol oxidase subunit 3
MGSTSDQFVHGLEDIPLAGINTIVLLGSSAAITFSVWSVRNHDYGRHRVLLGITSLLGVLFVGGKWLDYSHKFSEGLYPASSTYLAIFFTLTGVHALHVIGGIIATGFLYVTGRKLYAKDPERLLSHISIAALYWNFVDAIWLILFLLLYVL